MDELYIHCVASDLPIDALKVEIMAVEVIGAYVDCDNKNESLESLFKRCVVIAADGHYILQVHYI